MYAHAAALLLQQVLKTAVTDLQWQNTDKTSVFDLEVLFIRPQGICLAVE
jgi:hypothetical protein